MKKFYIICGVFCFCFLCLGIYFLIDPSFSNLSSSSTQGEETGGQEDDTQEEIIYYLGVDYAEINVFIDETAEIKYTILPLGSVPTVQVEDDSIIAVENFIIMPKKLGSTKVTLSHQTFTREIKVNVLEKELNLTFSENTFLSGKAEDGNYINYTAIIQYNFNYISKELKLSDNIQITNEELLENEIKLTFNLLNGTSFTFDITLDSLNVTKTLPCEEYLADTTPDEPDTTLPEEPDGTDPDDTLPEGPNPDDTQPQESAYYELYYNGEKLTDTLYYSYKPSETNTIIIEYKLCDESGSELEFNSSVSILDSADITKNSLDSHNYKLITLAIFGTGELELTLVSNLANATITLKIIVE